ncbi:MAG: helix-turn-helix domain-containing protein [Frankiales bacterium]|nr:helix-turn-helix domain-containing protein [Frankiales bacterium]
MAAVQASGLQASGLTLARLLDLLGAATIDAVEAPKGVDVAVAGPRMWDPSDPASVGIEEIVFAVNVDPTSPAAAAAVTDAAMAGATAIAFKGDRDQLDATLAPLAVARGVALLHVSADASWDQLHALVRNAAATSGKAVASGEDAPLGDLFALADALAAAIGAAVTVEAADSTLLAYSNLDHPIDEARRDTILGRRTPGKWAAVLEEEGIPRQILAAPPDTAVQVSDPAGQARDRLVIAVRAGGEIIGTIWAVEGDTPFDERARTLLEESAPLAALHLLRHRASDDLQRTERSGVLRALLDGRHDAADGSAMLGLDVATSSVVVNFQLVAGRDDVDVAVWRTRAVDLIVLACDAFRRRVTCVGIGPSVYALFPVSDDGGAALRRFVSELAGRIVDGLGVPVVAGIGSVAARLSDVPASRRDADRAARVLLHNAADQTGSVDDLRVASIMLELSDVLAAHPELRLPALDALVSYDAEHTKSYVATLRALARASWDNVAAARELNLHPNSLRYRLRRIEELTGLVLDDPAHRLLLSLHLLASGV